jgi:hydrogenase expression/formation protein HypC
MCLGVPGKIVEMYEQGGLLMGKIDFGGVAREVCLAYVPEAKIGDYAIVHVGFALNLLDEAEAQETLALLKEIGAFGEEFGAEAADANEELLAGGTVAGG